MFKERVYIDNVGQHVGKEVTLKGWVYNTRSSGKIKFLILRDGTGIIQSVLINGETDPNSFAHFDELTQESSVIVRGRVRKEPRAPGGYELTLLSFELLHAVKDYPIGP